MLVVNFYGGPGAGKSTASAGLFHLLKKSYVNAELVTEFAKDLVWSDSVATLSHQNLVFANQEHRLARLRGKVDCAISDSPLPLSALYAPEGYPESFRRLVMDFYGSYDNANYFVNRDPSIPYMQSGRIHSAAESDEIAGRMKEMLRAEGIRFSEVTAGDRLPERVFADLVARRQIEIPEIGSGAAKEILEGAKRAFGEGARRGPFPREIPATRRREA